MAMSQVILDDAQWLMDNLRRNQVNMHVFWSCHPEISDLKMRLYNKEKRREFEVKDACACIGGWLMWRDGIDMHKFIMKGDDPAHGMTQHAATRWQVAPELVYNLLHPWTIAPDGAHNPYWPGVYYGYKEEAVEAMRRFAASL